MRAVDLGRRSGEAEFLDLERADRDAIEACLHDLEWINRWTAAYRVTLRWLEEVCRATRPTRALTVVDVGCGRGDMLRRIWAWGREHGLELRLIGIDLNPHATATAAAATPDEAPIRYLTADVFATPQDLRADIALSALFAHHLDDARLVRFLRWMEERARLGWLVNDLHRHPLPYFLARGGAPLLRMHRFVRHDAPLSVARSFDRRDWLRLLTAADLAPPTTTIRWCFPFRFAVGRIKRAC
jgi:SAM-dependent methyltransferase